MPTTWDASDKSANIALSGGDLVATTTSTATGSVRASVDWSAKQYIEITLTALPGGGQAMAGVADASDGIGTLPGNSVGYNSTGDVYFGVSVVDTDTPLTVGNVWCLAVDAPNGRIWIRRNNGLWNKSAAADPGSNPVDYVAYGDVSITGAAAPWVVFSGASGIAVTVNFGATAFAYTPPTGYSGVDPGATGYSLTAALGTFTLAGQAAGLTTARFLTASAGALALTGQGANLVKAGSGAYTLAASVGASTLSGQITGLLAARLLGAASGGHAHTGQDAGVLVGRKAVADQGAFVAGGQAAGLAVARSLQAGIGALTLGGQAANLLRGGVAAYSMSVDGGVFAFAGRDAALLYSGYSIWTPVAPNGAGWTSVGPTGAAWSAAPANPGTWS